MRYSYNYGLDVKKKNKFKKIIFVIVVCIVVIIVASFIFKNSSNSVLKTISSVITKPIDVIFDATSNFSKRNFFSFCK